MSATGSLRWLSNTLDASFCVDALDDALRRGSTPDIFDSDAVNQIAVLCEAVRNRDPRRRALGRRESGPTSARAPP
jgi:hypothetical protein